MPGSPLPHGVIIPRQNELGRKHSEEAWPEGLDRAPAAWAEVRWTKWNPCAPSCKKPTAQANLSTYAQSITASISMAAPSRSFSSVRMLQIRMRHCLSFFPDWDPLHGNPVFPEELHWSKNHLISCPQRVQQSLSLHHYYHYHHY